jgi:hypothetical protein
MIVISVIGVHDPSRKTQKFCDGGRDRMVAAGVEAAGLVGLTGDFDALTR